MNQQNTPEASTGSVEQAAKDFYCRTYNEAPSKTDFFIAGAKWAATPVKREGEVKSKEEILRYLIDSNSWGYNYGNIESAFGTMNTFLYIALQAMEDYAAQFSTPTPLKEVERPNIKNYFPPEADLPYVLQVYKNSTELYNYMSDLDRYIDQLLAATPSKQSNEAIEENVLAYSEWFSKSGYKFSHFDAHGLSVFYHESEGLKTFDKVTYYYAAELYKLFSEGER